MNNTNDKIKLTLHDFNIQTSIYKTKKECKYVENMYNNNNKTKLT